MRFTRGIFTVSVCAIMAVANAHGADAVYVASQNYVDDAVENMEKTTNRVTTINSSSDDNHYPTALAVYNLSETHVKTGADATQTLASAYTVTGSMTVPDQTMPTADSTIE